jgi:hypothetical protein
LTIRSWASVGSQIDTVATIIAVTAVIGRSEK